MLLASVGDMRDDLGFDDMTDINEAIMAALNAAEPQLAAMLNTRFTYGSFVDRYFLLEPGYTVGNHCETEFRLKRGFVQTLDSFIVAGTFSDLVTTGSLVDTSSILLKADLGVVMDMQTAYNRQYVQISYTAGFPASQDDPTSYDPDAVPDWLVQAAKLKARILLNTTAPIIEAGLNGEMKMFQEQFDALMVDHLRYTPVAKLPM